MVEDKVIEKAKEVRVQGFGRLIRSIGKLMILVEIVLDQVTVQQHPQDSGSRQESD